MNSIIKEHSETGELYDEVALDSGTQAILFMDDTLIVKQGDAAILLSDVAAMHLAKLLLARSQKDEAPLWPTL